MKEHKPQHFSNLNLSKNSKLPDHFKSRDRAVSRKSKSPTISIRKSQTPESHLTSISSIPQTEKLKKMSKLAPSKQKMQNIKFTLEIETQCKRNYEQRKKNNNFYFKYEPHSFSVSKQTQLEGPEELAKKNIERYKPYQNNQLLKLIIDLRTKQHFRQIRLEKEQKISLANRIFNQMKKNEKPLKSWSKIQAQQTENDFHLDVSPFLCDIIEKQSPFQDLDNIVSRKEEKFFVKKIEKQELNLFQFRRNPNADCFMSGWQRLEKQHFCFNPAKPLSNKRFNEQIQKSLSTYARISAINSKSKSITNQFKLQQGDIDMNENNLGLKDLLLLASGQLLPLLLQKKRNQLQDIAFQDDTSLIEGTNLIFRENQHCKSTLKQDNSKHKKNQLKEYLKMPLISKQQQQTKRAQIWRQRLETLIKIQAKYKNYRIDDQSLQKFKKNQRNQLLLKQLNSIPHRKQGESKQIQRMIRISKLKKDKSERIKILATIKNVQQNKKFQQRGKSKSQNKKQKTSSVIDQRIN